ncbi:MAG: cell division protein FtsA [Weeksellaceae bacterium]
MRNNGIAVGLDIGTTKIVAMVGRKNENNKIEILGKGEAKSLGVNRGVVNNITQTVNSIKEAVRQAEEASGIKIKDVTVGIAGQHIRSLQHSDYITRPNFEEVIDENDLKKLISQVYKLVMLPGEEIIHVLPQEYKVDSEGEVTEPIGMYGSRLEANFHVVVGQVTSIKNIARCVKSAGLNLAGITLEPIASADATLSKEEKEAGVALMDIGGGTTDIAVFKDNMIRHTAVIPFGGNVITEDIKTGCSIIERQAEQLKVKFGSAWPGENKDTEIVSIPGLRGRDPKEISLKRLSQIIHARVQEILGQAYLELKHYGCEDQKRKLIAGIVLTGGGSNLKHIRQLTEYLTGMDVRIGKSDEHIVGEGSEKLYGPEYATSVGLVMKGLERMEELYEEEVEEEAMNENVSSTERMEDNTQAENPGSIKEKIPFFGKKKEKAEKETELKEKTSGEKVTKANVIFQKWADKFIKLMNETE